ncbi:hypothetical protein [Glycomyces salinus]|uniref:hypothetical protein n=1 Tax=Glycomyces salinus TaxID=980294 RepID=UPI0018EDB33D|nr:hypothetical protein [Glycomyces salinus]
MTDSDLELRAPRRGNRTPVWYILLLVGSFLMGMTTAIVLTEGPWWWDQPSRSERVLGQESDDPALCSDVIWKTATSGSESFRFVEVVSSANGSYEYAGGCEVRFDVLLDDEPAGQAAIEVETLRGFPRDLPWGSSIHDDCTRVFQASSELFDQITNQGSGILPEDEACIIRADSTEGPVQAGIWSTNVYGDFRDYAEITLIDLGPEGDAPVSRAEAFAQFFTSEFTEAVERYLPS